RQAMSALTGLGPRPGDAMLVASELVSNAVRRSRCTARDDLDVQVRRFDDHVLITVHEPRGPQRKARIASFPEPSVGGFGLRIVDQLTRAWGSGRRDGYVVWAELPLAA